MLSLAGNPSDAGVIAGVTLPQMGDVLTLTLPHATLHTPGPSPLLSPPLVDPARVVASHPPLSLLPHAIPLALPPHSPHSCAQILDPATEAPLRARLGTVITTWVSTHVAASTCEQYEEWEGAMYRFEAFWDAPISAGYG